MKRKSFGKLAIVTVLATLMLFGLCVCSKKADTSTTTTTTTAAATTPAATTTTTTAEKTTTTTAKAEEPKAETKVEEPVAETKVEEPVVETVVEEPVVEAVVEEPVVETVVEESVAEVETASVEEIPAFSAIFSYKGVTSNIVAYRDHASITVPEGVTADDISTIASLLLMLYPEAAEVTYSYQDGTLYLTYPEQAVEFIQTAIATLDSQAKWYIDEVTAVAEEIEEVAEEVAAAVEEVIESTELTIADDGTITCTYNYHDLATAKIVMGNEQTTITYPAEYIYSSDIEAFIASLVEAYPSLAEYITYDIPEEGTLEIYYPAEYVGGTYYKLETLAYADEAVTAYADAILGELLNSYAEEAVAEAVDEEVEEAVEEDVPVFSTIFTYKGITSEIYAYSDYAVLSVPEGVTEEDIAALAEMLVAAYPEAEAVQYLLADGALILFYPEQSDAFVQAAVAQLESDAVYVIDLLTAEEEVEEVAVAEVEEEAVEETVAEEVPVFSTIFTYRGITSNVVAYSDYAVLTIPEGTSEADIASCAAMLVEAYPEAALVQYAVADNTLTLYYPAQSDEFVQVACATLESEAKYLIDAVYASFETETAVAAVVEEAPAAVVEEAPAAVVEEAPAAVVEEAPAAVVEEAPAAVVEEKAEEPVVVAAPAPVAEPVAAKESFIKSFSVGGVFEGGYNFNAKSLNYAVGLRGELEFTDKISAGLEVSYNFKYKYLHADAYGKYTFAEFGKLKVYGAGGVGLDVSFKGKKAGLTLNAAVGAEYEIIDNLAAFAEIGYQYSFLTKSSDLSLSVGAKYTF